MRAPPSIELANGFYDKPSPLDRLAAALFTSSVQMETRLMGMFTACFDAAGNAQKQLYVIVSGYSRQLRPMDEF
jgi:hypothetical protein